MELLIFVKEHNCLSNIFTANLDILSIFWRTFLGAVDVNCLMPQKVGPIFALQQLFFFFFPFNISPKSSKRHKIPTKKSVKRFFRRISPIPIGSKASFFQPWHWLFSRKIVKNKMRIFFIYKQNTLSIRCCCHFHQQQRKVMQIYGLVLMEILRVTFMMKNSWKMWMGE